MCVYEREREREREREKVPVTKNVWSSWKVKSP